METLLSQIEDLSRAKGIDPQIVVDAVKDAIVVAARKYYKSSEDLVAEFNSDNGRVEVYAIRTVTDLVADPSREIGIADARRMLPDVEVGAQIRSAKPTEALGRISAQLAKQVIFQKIREAERETIFNEFSGRIGEIVSCVVKRAEGPDLIVDIGRTEARLPRREQSRLESFSPGDRVRCVIKTIEKAGRGPAVVVSRAAEELVKTLFEQEVPEIYDGTVMIRACAREAGERTKIAVQSRDRDVDAVGACVGMKGMRVQSIIRELRGEKIDIIEFSEDPIEMATRALSPAKIGRVTVLDGANKHLEVVVDDTQLSLAIGKKGQNVRLAARLMDWRIDIKSEEEKRQEVENAMAAMSGPGTPLAVLTEHGLDVEIVDKLVEADITTVERLADMTPEELEAIPDVGEALVEKIQVAVNGFYLQFEAAAQQSVYAPVAPRMGMDRSGEIEAAGQPAAESPQSAGPVKPPMTMPGLPVEGAGADDEDDEEDFGGDGEDEGEYDEEAGEDLEDSATIDGEEAEEVLAGRAEPSAAEGEPHPASAGETESENPIKAEVDDDGIVQQDKE